MIRLAAILALCFLAIGCGGRKLEYQASGQPKAKFELRAASTQPVEDWQAVTLEGDKEEQLFLSPEVALSNSDVASTGVENSTDGPPTWQVNVWLNDAGKLKLAKLSKELVEPASEGRRPTKRVALLLDGKVVFAPSVRSEITNGRFQFEPHLGSYSEAEIGRAHV